MADKAQADERVATVAARLPELEAEKKAAAAKKVKAMYRVGVGGTVVGCVV